MEQTRGDTKKYYFQRKKADGTAIIDLPDALYFTVKKNYIDNKALIQKKLSDMTVDQEGKYHFTIEPGDTDKLPYGGYVFDIQVTVGDIKTTIAKGTFVLTEEVTFAENEV